MVEERRRAGRPNGAARDQAYAAIRRCFKHRMAEFYRDHPEWIDDERSRRGINSAVTMLKCILLELDNYEIDYQAPKVPPQILTMGFGLGVFLSQFWDALHAFIRGRS
jgi:hypothetical protein